MGEKLLRYLCIQKENELRYGKVHTDVLILQKKEQFSLVTTANVELHMLKLLLENTGRLDLGS